MADQTNELPPLPQRELDALLDHIYEYGTIAEGIRERALKLCEAYARAALASQTEAWHAAIELANRRQERIRELEAALASRQAPEDRPDCYCICGTRPHYGAAKYDRAKKEASDLRGECNVLAGIIRDCDAVLATIEPENDDEAERLSDLRTAITYALDPYKREGTLL